MVRVAPVCNTYGHGRAVLLPPRGLRGSPVNLLRARLQARGVSLEAPVVVALTEIIDGIVALAGLVGRSLDLLQGSKRKDEVLDALKLIRDELQALKEQGLAAGKKTTPPPEVLAELLGNTSTMLETTAGIIRDLAANLPTAGPQP